MIVEQNIPLAKSDGMLTKAMKLNIKYSMFPDSIIAAGKFLIVTQLLILLLVLYNGP